MDQSNEIFAVHKVCILLSELWFMFRKTLFASTNLERLGYHPDSSVLKKFWSLCVQQLSISG